MNNTTPLCLDCGRPGDELDALLLEILAPLGVVLECVDCGCALCDDVRPPGVPVPVKVNKAVDDEGERP